MKQLIMEVRKRNPDTGELDTRTVDVTPLVDILTTHEIFAMEYKMNEILSIRIHLSLNEKQ